MAQDIDRKFRLAASWVAALLASTCLSAPAWATTFTVTNGADSGAGSLRDAITQANSAGGTNTININPGVGTITLTSGDLPTISNNLTLNANGATVSGNNQFRGLFIAGFSGTTQTAVSVSVSDLTITNTKAQGGIGNTGGGGGAGLGGAIFVANRATVTVSNVSLTSNAANGGAGMLVVSGNGGGGGMGGNSGFTANSARAGGGGLGVGADGGNGAASGSAGIATGGASGGAGAGNAGSGGLLGGGGGGGADINNPGGGGGGVGGAAAVGNLGGIGGFGGGGGGTAGINAGAAGGFGGGGGAGGGGGGVGGFGGGGGGGSTGTGGVGGFGGGSGNNTANSAGGGGAGMGGAIFVQGGGSLNLAGPLTITGNSVAGGANGGNGATSGSAFGSGIFLQGNGAVTFTPSAGQTQTVSNVIADQTGSGGAGPTAGSYGLTKNGAGTLALGAANTYSGGTTINGGLVNFSAATNFGSGSITLNGGGLQWAAGTTTDISSRLAALGAGGGTLDTNGNNVSFASALSGAGGLTKQGTGTLTLTGSNSYTGATTIGLGTLALAGSTLSSSSLLTVNSGATFDISGNGPGFTSIKALAGAGVAQLGGNGLVITAASTEFSGGIAGTGGLEIAGGAQTLSGANSYTNATQIDQGASLALKGNGSIASSAYVGFAPLLAGVATFDISQTSSGASVGALFDTAGVGVVSLGSQALTITGGSSFNGVIQDGGIGGGAGGSLVIGAGASQSLGGVNTYTGATTVMTGGTLSLTGSGSMATSSSLNLAGTGATFDLSGASGNQTIKDLSGVAGSTIALGANSLTVGTANSTIFAGSIGGTGSFTKQGSGTLTLSGTNSYSGGTTLNAGTLAVGNNAALGTGALTFATGTTLQAAATGLTLANAMTLNGANTVDTQTNTLTLGGVLSASGGLTKIGTGSLILTGANTYSGGTTVSGGILQGTTSSLQGNIVNNASVVFNQAGSGTYAGTMSGTGSLTLQGGGMLTLIGANSYTGGTTVSAGTLIGNSTSLQGNITNNASVVFNQAGSGIYAGNMSGGGSMTLQGGGYLNMTGTNTYTGGTTVNASTLAVNGSLAGNVTLNNGGMLQGNGTVGGVVSNGGTVAPGNSIGTLTVSGNFAQNGGVYQVEANAAGQSDRINVGGAASIGGGATVQVLAQPGTYQRNTTYTILTANGGVSGAYSGVSSNFAFLTPSLSYDANDVYLTLLTSQSAFAAGAQTPNQYAVGTALDRANSSATGDLNTVLNALASLSFAQGPAALNTISGQQWADFGTVNVNQSALFMSAVGQQMATARGAAGGARQALAQACDVSACEGDAPGSSNGPWSVWASGLGGLGSALGDSNASTLTYNFGGGAAGIDYRFSPNVLLGISSGYTSGNMWVNGFSGQGYTNSVAVAAYGSFTQGAFYADLLGGYAYFNNWLSRPIAIPGLAQRTARGTTGANQVLGQAEAGYKIGIYEPAKASVTPFALFQGSSVTQNAFSEGGANSLSLNVAAQATASLRSIFGTDLAGSIGLGNTRTLDLDLRLGWQHEYANTARPITAALAGAPGFAFTVYGATPTTDAAVLGFSAKTQVADSAQIYLRYDGQIGTGTDNHALNVGVRFSW